MYISPYSIHSGKSDHVEVDDSFETYAVTVCIRHCESPERLVTHLRHTMSSLNR